MEQYEILAIAILLVISITIGAEIYMIRYRTYLSPKKRFSKEFWDPCPFPEDGEDAAFCVVCHGRLGPDLIAACACGNLFHPECLEGQDCPGCGNDLRHMHIRPPMMILCPICIRPAPDGYCGHCDITMPYRNGTFRCSECGTMIRTSDPVCRKCGSRFVPRTTKGYMSKVR